MKTLIPRTLFAVIALVPISCAGISSFTDAVVKEHEGQPCFETINTLAMRNLQAVVVYDQSTMPPKSMWVALIDPSRESKEITGCVIYGQKFLSQSPAAPATALQTGRVYEVILNAPPLDSDNPTRGHRAQFCLVTTPESKRIGILQISWDKQLGRWRNEVCTNQTFPH